METYDLAKPGGGYRDCEKKISVMACRPLQGEMLSTARRATALGRRDTVCRIRSNLLLDCSAQTQGASLAAVGMLLGATSTLDHERGSITAHSWRRASGSGASGARRTWHAEDGEPDRLAGRHAGQREKPDERLVGQGTKLGLEGPGGVHEPGDIRSENTRRATGEALRTSRPAGGTSWAGSSACRKRAKPRATCSRCAATRAGHPASSPRRARAGVGPLPLDPDPQRGIGLRVCERLKRQVRPCPLGDP